MAHARNWKERGSSIPISILCVRSWQNRTSRFFVRAYASDTTTPHRMRNVCSRLQQLQPPADRDCLPPFFRQRRRRNTFYTAMWCARAIVASETILKTYNIRFAKLNCKVLYFRRNMREAHFLMLDERGREFYMCVSSAYVHLYAYVTRTAPNRYPLEWIYTRTTVDNYALDFELLRAPPAEITPCESLLTYLEIDRRRSRRLEGSC